MAYFANDKSLAEILLDAGADIAGADASPGVTLLEMLLTRSLSGHRDSRREIYDEYDNENGISSLSKC
jgi:hypothetical protein